MKSKYIPIVLFTLLFVCPVLAQAEPAKAGQRQGRALSKTSQPGSEKDEEKQQGAITALAESGNPVEEMIQAEADAGGGTGFGMPMPLRPSALLGDAPNLEVFRKEKSQLLSFPDLQPPPQVPIVPTTALVDKTPPEIILSGLPAPLTKEKAANIAAQANEPTTYIYTLDGAVVTSPQLTNLSEGSHTFTVKATDPMGNSSSKAYSWITDYTPPGLTLSSTPAALTNANSASFIPAADEPSSYSYRLDGAAVTSPNLANLSEGSHTFTVTATDPAGNNSTKTYTWVTDYTAPTIALSSTPPAITNLKTAGIGVAANEQATYSYSFDGTVVDTPNFTNLPEGSHIFRVTATDPVGNSSTKTYSWVTDYTAPTIALSSTPASITNVKTAGIGVAANEPVTYGYSLDGMAVASPNLADLSEGSHTFTVTATDPAGNNSTRTYTWVTDYTAPAIELSAMPATLTSATTAGISATANEPATYSYRLDGTAVASPNLTNLPEGNHTFTVTATDPAGNSSTKTYEWFIGLRSYTLAGSTSGSLPGSVLSSSSGIRAISDKPSGSWLMEYGGNGSVADSSVLNFVAGGTVAGANGADEGYWLSRIGNADALSGNIAGSSNIISLSATKLGIGTGIISGTYSADAWRVTDSGLGGYSETPLALGAQIDAAYHYYDNIGETITSLGGFRGSLLGITASPFISAAALNVPGNPTSLYLMGQDVPLGENTWWGNLSTPYFAEGGALPVGLLGGRTTSHYDYAAGAYTGFREGQEGLLLGLYIDKDGHGVVLEGSYSGDFFPQDDGQGNNNQGLFLSTGDLRATWKASGFGPTDSYNFSAIDGAYSGQIQDGAGNAAGSVMSSPLGIFGSSYGFLSSNAYWLEWNGTPEPWGIFNLELGGAYQLAEGAGAPQNWQLRLGGTALRNLESNEFWIAETANGSWAETAGDKRIAADLTGRYMTPTTLGVLNGRVLGSYDSNNTPGNWEAIALGAFENTAPLLFSAQLNNVSTHYNGQADATAPWQVLADVNTHYAGYLGSIVSPFATATTVNVPGDAVDLHMIGEAAPAGRTAWWGNLYETTIGNGALLPDGFIAGRTTAGYAGAANLTSQEALRGFLTTLYIDQDGSAGVLEGAFNGLYYPLRSGSGMFEATSGSLWATKKADGYVPGNWQLGWNDLNGYFSGSFLDETGQAAGAITGDGDIADISSSVAGHSGSYVTWLEKYGSDPNLPAVREPWGIFNIELGGHYTDPSTNNWALALGGISDWRDASGDGYWLATVYGTQWSDPNIDGNQPGVSQQITGNLRGSYLTPRFWGTMTGALLGSCDPDPLNPDAWVAVTHGTFEETPLSLGARLDAAYHYYDNLLESVNISNGNLAGLLGTTASPFAAATTLNVAGDPVDLYLMGRNAPYGDTTWWGKLSEVYLPEGGDIPVGLLGGRTTSHYDYATGFSTTFREGQEGLLLGLYIDKDGRGGILEGAYDGDFYPQDYGLFLATGNLRATWKASGFGPTDSYNFSAIDGAYSGQIQDGAGNAAGSVMSSPLGIFGSSYGFLSSNTYWLEWNGTPEPWGIFNLELGGIYQLSAGAGAPQNWQLRLGGTALRNLESNEYWIAETANGSWAETAGDKRIAADLAGRYMTPTTLGVLNGRVLGSYDSNNTPGNWEAIALGTFENTVPLQFVSDLANGNGALSALVGGATSLWTATTSPLTMMGAWDGSNGIWAAPLASHNFLDGTATTYDNGAYQGFSSLLLDGGQGISGDLIALYADPNGQTGYLKGTLTGAGYADLRLFTADGSMTRSAMDQAPQGIDAANFSSNVTESGQILLSMTGAPAAVGFLSEARNEASISGQGSWGIWQSLLEGDGAATAPGAWSWQTTAGMDATYWTNYDNVQWQTATSGMTGTVTGAKADWVAAATSVYGGEIKGLFDPATAGWKAISQGAAIETGRFLEMAAGNPAALLAMNIPAIQVGSATLSQGAGTINNLSNVAMTDVRFFATSTGSAPRIWATNNVAGNYAAAGPVPGGTVVPLSSGAGPNNITANFGITNWSNGNWGAQVTNGRTNGSAAVGGFGVQFQGGAAGKIGNGSFTGTGAGIVKVP